MATRVLGTRRSTINKRRKGALSVILPWLKRFGVLLLVATFGVWLGAWLWMSGSFQKMHSYTQNEIIAFTSALGFKIANVEVEGRVFSDAEVLKAIVDTQKGAPLFSFDPAAARAKIEAMEWVKHATVERRLPGTVYIRLEEHKPLALWQQGETLKLLDEEGGVVGTKRLGRFKDLMIVMGDDAPSHAPELLENLNAETILMPHITSARWMDGRRWDLLLKEGITVKLPENDSKNDLGLALRRLAQAETDDAILKKDITAIDLREPDRIILRTRPGALQDFKAEQAAKAGDNI